MKKIIAMLLCLALMGCCSAVAETAEAVEPAGAADAAETAETADEAEAVDETEAAAAAEAESQLVLGTVGEYIIKYDLPEGYKMTIINAANTSIIATLMSETAGQPMITLSIAFNDSYTQDGKPMRLNEVSEEEVALIKESFEEETEVAGFEDGETALGTKVLIVRGTIAGTNYADVYSIYNSYEVEAVMTPAPGTEDTTLTEEQIQTVIDFFSSMDFVETWN